MRKNSKKIIAFALTCTSIFAMFGCQKDKGIVLPNVTTAKNVILLIGDGMGQQHIRAGEIYNEGKLTMQKFPYSVMVETRSWDSEVTDSAAAATAMATGVRTLNGFIGMSEYAEPLETIIDIASALGKRTGVITTEGLTGATPMGFSSHSISRDNSNELLIEAVNSNVNLFLCDLYSGEENLLNGGYEKVVDPNDISKMTGDKLCGSYAILASAPSMMVSEDYCALDGLVVEALEYLSQDPDGFFLMAEGARIDKMSHNNEFELMLNELMAFDNAVAAVLEWAKERDDTVVIVTADHETGALELSSKMRKKNMFTASGFELGGYYQWNSINHSGDDVYCFINGANIDFSKYSFNSKKRIKNTDIFQIMKSLMAGF